MTIKSNEDKPGPDFRQIIAAYTDDEIKIVLKKRKLYQKDAADFAVQEAVRRGIIYSEQDLFAKEYKYEPEKFSLFPTIENPIARAKFKKSLTRSLLILGIVPMVLGGIKILDSQILNGISLFVFGASWSFASYKLMQRLDKRLMLFLYLCLFVTLAYVVKMMVDKYAFTTVDILIAFIGLGFASYAIGFLAKLKD